MSGDGPAPRGVVIRFPVERAQRADTPVWQPDTGPPPPPRMGCPATLSLAGEWWPCDLPHGHALQHVCQEVLAVWCGAADA
jgi:hypothetical protein